MDIFLLVFGVGSWLGVWYVNWRLDAYGRLVDVPVPVPHARKAFRRFVLAARARRRARHISVTGY